MKKDTHPEMHPVIFRDTDAGADFIGLSTAVSEEKETRDGVEYAVIQVEISSASHPFYTGEEHIVDSAGRVEKFKTRAERKGVSGTPQKNRKPRKKTDVLEKQEEQQETKQQQAPAKQVATKKQRKPADNDTKTENGETQ